MYVNVVRTFIRCGTNVYLGGTKVGGTKRHWYEKPAIHSYCIQHHFGYKESYIFQVLTNFMALLSKSLQRLNAFAKGQEAKINSFVNFGYPLLQNSMEPSKRKQNWFLLRLSIPLMSFLILLAR